MALYFLGLRFFKSVLTERILAPFGIIDIFSKCCMKPTKRCPKVFETVLLVLAASKTHQSHLHGRQTPLLVLNVTHELSISWESWNLCSHSLLKGDVQSKQFIGAGKLLFWVLRATKHLTTSLWLTRDLFGSFGGSSGYLLPNTMRKYQLFQTGLCKYAFKKPEPYNSFFVEVLPVSNPS